MPAIAQTMKAIVTHGTEDARIEQIPVPEYEPDNVLVKVAVCGICGTDDHLLAGKLRPMWPPYYPFVQGHEWGGTVVAIGGEARTDLQVGDRVAMEPTVACATCKMCIQGDYHLCENSDVPDSGYKLLGHTVDGAFSEYGAAPPKNLHRIPDSMGWEGAVVANHAALAVHAFDQGRIEPADTVAVIGPGVLGLMVLQVAKALGASKTFMAGRGYRLDIARELGADVVIDVTKEDPAKVVMEETGGRGVDLSCECAGPVEAMQQALAVVRRGGRVVLQGVSGGMEVPFTTDRIVLDEISIYGARGCPNCYPRGIQLIADGHIRVDKLVTHSYPLDQFHEAMRMFRAREDGAVRVVLCP